MENGSSNDWVATARSQSLAVVGDRDHDALVERPARVNSTGAPVGGVAAGVVEQLAHDPADPRAVGDRVQEVGGDLSSISTAG